MRAIQTLPERSRCVSDSGLADLRHHVDVIEAGAARTQEAYRLFWLMDLLGQNTRVQQWDRQMDFPYRDPVVPYLPPPEPEQVEALRHAASAAADEARGITGAAKASVAAPPIPATAPPNAAPE